MLSMIEILLQLLALAIGAAIFAILLFAAAPKAVLKIHGDLTRLCSPYIKFCYASFLKPHTGDASGKGQQAALESFYKDQADGYDLTRASLLRGREHMLNLAAAQLQSQADIAERKPHIWVDIGGGTGYNIEAMSAFVSVPEFFDRVYLVDFSPSLCAVAQKRFKKLGWNNVHVICQDARLFRLEDYEPEHQSRGNEKAKMVARHADLVTMSYSLSMIPDFHSVVDSLISLLSPTGVIGAVDFYVQSLAEVQGRNYVGGTTDRHVNWLSRAFWRAWFEADRVNLDSARRDYLEYRFGTVLSISDRNYRMGGIPYYAWIGCQKTTCRNPAISSDKWEDIRAVALNQAINPNASDLSTISRIPPKALSAAKENLAARVPLPSFFYQRHPWRIYYNDQARKHTQFNNEYIYAFTWEDPKVDKELLNIGPEDQILAITSAGDNILSYLLEKPAKIHAVDLNPAQNHLLELKLASFVALGSSDVWQMFGEGYHMDFRRLLLSKLSPHLSSRAFQYWTENADIFSKGGLYSSGGSRHALKLVKWLVRISGRAADVRSLCDTLNLDDQVQLWYTRVRRIVFNRLVSWAIVCQEKFLWKALGVPQNQKDMITQDFLLHQGITDGPGIGEAAIRNYMVNTLDPVIKSSLLRCDNYFYLLCLQGRYSEKCRPEYLTPQAFSEISNLTDRISIHTDELFEVVSSMAPSSLTIAVIMDSMDWFEKDSVDALKQVAMLYRVLKVGGKVLLRSAGLRPWYLRDFEQGGFELKSAGQRVPGTCIDRVNMYASCWVCTKVE